MLTMLLSAAACGGGDDSSGAGGTTELAAPTGLKAAPLDGGAHLTWKDNSAEAEFMIERMDHSGSADWAMLATVPFDTTQYHDASVKAGTTYMYRVMPMSKDGKHGSTSNEVTFMASGGSAGSGGM